MSRETIEAYTDAVISISTTEGVADRVEDELFRFARAVDANEELRSTLSNALIPADRRQQIIADLLENKGHRITVSLLSMLIAAGRFGELDVITETIGRRAAERLGAAHAVVRSAVAMSDDQKARLTEALTKSIGRQVSVRVEVDASLLGGVVTEIDDQVIDGTVRSRLAQLRDAL